MANGSQTLTTYYAKRIMGDNAAANDGDALLQTGIGITSDTWILNHSQRFSSNSKLYGIKYDYDSNGHDKILFCGDGENVTIQLDTGDLSINGAGSIGSTLTVTGKTTLSNQLEVASSSLFKNNVKIQTSTSPTLTLESTASNATDWDIKNTSGTFTIVNTGTAATYLYGKNTTNNGWEIHPRLYVNVNIPTTTNPTLYNLYINGSSYLKGDTKTNAIFSDTDNTYDIGVYNNRYASYWASTGYYVSTGTNYTDEASVSVAGSALKAGHLEMTGATDAYIDFKSTASNRSAYTDYNARIINDTVGCLTVKGYASTSNGTTTYVANNNKTYNGTSITTALYTTNGGIGTDWNIWSSGFYQLATHSTSNAATIINNDGYKVYVDNQQYAQLYASTIGTTSQIGVGTLILGNDITSGADKNAQGSIILYGTNAYYTKIQSLTTNHTTNRMFYLPSYNGDMYAIHSDGTATGSSTKGIYVDANGRVAATDVSINTSANSSRIAYYSATGTISGGSIVTDGEYLGSVSYLSINKAHQTNYRLWSQGSTMTIGNNILRHETFDTAQSNNGLSESTGYGWYFQDKNGRDITRVLGYGLTSGNTSLYLQARNYNGSTATTYGGIVITANKSDNTIAYTVTSPANFRSAIGAGTSSLTIGTTASTAAAGNHTHTCTIATDTGTNQVTLAYGTKYKLTAGGSTYIFTTPSLGTSATTAAAGNHTHSYLPLSGGTVTGTLYLKNTAITLASSGNGVTETQSRIFYYVDNGGNGFARIVAEAYPASHATYPSGTGISIQARSYSGSAYNSYGGIGIRAKKDGTFAYSVSSAANFRSAISAAPSTVVDVSNTSASGYGVTAYCYKSGKTVMITFAMSSSSGATSTISAGTTIFTVPSGYRPIGLWHGTAYKSGSPVYIAISSAGALTCSASISQGQALIGSVTYPVA